MFIPMNVSSKKVAATGDTDAKIAIICDCADGFDIRNMRALSGPRGNVLEQCLHAAGLIRGEVYITLLIKEQPKKKLKSGNEFFTARGKRFDFSSEGMLAVDALKEELIQVNPNVIITAGPACTFALAGIGSYTTYRGYFFMSSLDIKIIPTFDPGSTIWANYERRHVIVSDLKKASNDSGTKELIRPERTLILEYTDIGEALQWLEYFEDTQIVSVDIEVINYEVSCISFSSAPDIAISMPIHGRWDLEEEMQIWRAIQRILGNERSIKVFQNGIFDIQFLLTRNGVETRGPIHDTMIAHSIMYPDLKKGLGFLGSIYCGTQEYWKDTVKFNNIKGES